MVNIDWGIQEQKEKFSAFPFYILWFPSTLDWIKIYQRHGFSGLNYKLTRNINIRKFVIVEWCIDLLNRCHATHKGVRFFLFF